VVTFCRRRTARGYAPRVPAFVHEAVVQLDGGTDRAAVGAAVTVALCGHWEHEPPCRWPHNNELGEGGTFRTLFVAPDAEEAEVREKIVGALRSELGWHVTRDGSRDVAPAERELAERLSR
jgi:hypothetical protein